MQITINGIEDRPKKNISDKLSFIPIKTMPNLKTNFVEKFRPSTYFLLILKVFPTIIPKIMANKIVDIGLFSYPKICFPTKSLR